MYLNFLPKTNTFKCVTLISSINNIFKLFHKILKNNRTHLLFHLLRQGFLFFFSQHELKGIALMCKAFGSLQMRIPSHFLQLDLLSWYQSWHTKGAVQVPKEKERKWWLLSQSLEEAFADSSVAVAIESCVDVNVVPSSTLIRAMSKVGRCHWSHFCFCHFTFEVSKNSNKMIFVVKIVSDKIFSFCNWK